MKRPILWGTIFIICGIYMRLGISEMMCLVSFVFPVVIISHFAIKTKNRTYLLFFIFLIVGFLIAEHSVAEKKTTTKLSEVVSGNGVVKETGKTTAGNQKLTIMGELEDEFGNTSGLSKIYMIWSGEGRLEEGDRIEFSGENASFYEQTVPGGYDEKLYMETRGYDYKVYPEWIVYTGQDDSVSSMMARMRGKIHCTLDTILPAEESGIMKAMLTGDKDDISEEAYQLYTKAGVVHVLCISGLHMTCLALYVAFFMEKILKRSRRSSAVVTMLMALGFLLFTGLTPSAVRAVIMICIVMIGRVIFRLHDRLNEISIAALLILLVEPLYLFHIGFQLSFITVLGLCQAAEHMDMERNKDRTWKDWLKDSFFFSLYATLFSFPLVAYHFHSISLAGILANLIIIPLSGLLLGFGILSAILGILWIPAGIFAAGSVYVILQIFKCTCTVLLELPFAYVLTGQFSEGMILLYYGLLLFWMKYRYERRSWIFAASISAALFVITFQNSLFQKETTIVFLDVGQGDCAVISTYNEEHYLVDGGGLFGKDFGSNIGKTTILPYLEYLRVDVLDGAFLSHPDKDHMIGLLEVLEEIPTKGLYVSDYAFEETEEVMLLKEMVEKFHIPLYTVKAGDSDGAFSCFYPSEKSYSGEDNHGSMVLKYRYADVDVLFTGDITAEDEAFLLQENEDLSAAILKVSHHGSQYSSSFDFLSEIDADAAIISCGKNNIYGHPHTSVLERLEKAGTEIYRTDLDGSVLVKIRSDGSYDIETMAERKPFYENIKEKLEK